MGWNRKAKFGIHSGRTLRSCPTRKYHSFHYSGNTKTTDEYVVVKAVFKPQSEGRLVDVSQNNNLDQEILGIDDGMPWEVPVPQRRYPNYPVIHSMNKHKRWMLPDLVKECIEQNYAENQDDKDVPKKVKRTEKNGPKQSDKFRVTAVERHASSFVSRQTPDCFSVASTEPCSKSNVVRSSTKRHAHVGDLKPKSSAEQCELYYEFLSPYPEKSWPNNRQVDCYVRYQGEVYGNKSRNKCKGRRNKHYRHGIPLEEHQMSDPFPEDTVTADDVHVNRGHYTNQVSSDSLFAIGTYIHNVIEMSSRKNEGNVCSNKPKNPTPTSHTKYGKGDAIYVDEIDKQDPAAISPQTISNRLVDNSNGLQNVNIFPDVKSHSRLFVKDIHPDHLMEEFKDNYYEGQIDSTVVKKTSPKIERIPVKFIQDICQEEPEVCGITRAFQYSTSSDVSTRKLKNSQELSHVNKYPQANDSYCSICLLHLEELHESGLTSLAQCSHMFCNDCWKNYIVTCIQAGQGSISCPNWNCAVSVSEPLIWSSTNSEYYQTYCKIHYQHTINTNPKLRPCPAPNCSHLAYVPKNKPQSSLPIHCHCGEVWCFQCQKAAHWPASCEEAEAFRQKHGDYEEYKKTLLHEERIKSVMVKRCPFCQYPIYKNIGCQHMVCRCQNEFCWECLSPWADHEWPCDKRVKALEEVELTDVNGNARYNKYCKVSHLNYQERSRKKVKRFLKMMTMTMEIENCHKLVSDSETVPCSQLVRSYVKYGISSHVQAIFHFKYLAHVVMENTAAAMAVARYTKMVGRLDKIMQTLTFIVHRFNEVLLEPTLLTDKENLERVCELLKSGQRLIKEIYKLTRANRKIN